MPAYNFQEPFVPLILNGSKCTTIRGREAKVGALAYLFTGMRTKACVKLGVSEIIFCKPIALGRSDSGMATVKLANRKLSVFDADVVAMSDGFLTSIEMVKWFEKTYKLPVNNTGCAHDVFNGYLIEWAPL